MSKLYNDRTDQARLAEVAQCFRDHAALTLVQAQTLLDHKYPGAYEVRIFEAGRSRAKQLAYWRRGRKHTPAGWKIVGKTVTDARPEKAPHCVVDRAGLPASMAVDFWVLLRRPEVFRGERRTIGALLHNKHPAWSCVPAAAYMVAGTGVAVGAMFSKGSGDWPHVERANWRDLVENGVLR